MNGRVFKWYHGILLAIYLTPYSIYVAHMSRFKVSNLINLIATLITHVFLRAPIFLSINRST